MNIRKYILLGGITVAMMSGALFFADAQDVTQPQTPTPGTTMVKPLPSPDRPRPMILRVEPNGGILLRGKVVSVSPSSSASDDKTGTIVVNSWGGDWTVKTGPITAFLPGGGLSNIQKDDFVGVQGWAGNSLTIDASAPGDVVRNWTARQEIKANRAEAKDLIKDITPRNWQGTFKSLILDGFILTVDGVDYTVALVPGAKVYNKDYVDMDLADIKTGHSVRFYGTVSGTTATAYVVRDVSLSMRPKQ